MCTIRGFWTVYSPTHILFPSQTLYFQLTKQSKTTGFSTPAGVSL